MKEGDRGVVRHAIAVMTALKVGDVPAASSLLREADDLEELAFTLGSIAAHSVTDESIRSAALDVAERDQ